MKNWNPEADIERYVAEGRWPTREQVMSDLDYGSHRARLVAQGVRDRLKAAGIKAKAEQGRKVAGGRMPKTTGELILATAGEKLSEHAGQGSERTIGAERTYADRDTRLDEGSLFEIAVSVRDAVKAGELDETGIQARYGVGLNHARSIVFGCTAGLFDGAEASTREAARYAPNTAPEHVRMPWSGPVLVIGDTHIPFEHKGYLDFCQRVRDRYGCTSVIHIGDEVDNHAISFHDSDPDGLSAGMEAEAAVARLKRWYAAFPDVVVTTGNHSGLPLRQAYTRGLPKRMMKSLGEVWEAPPSWRWTMRATMETASGGVRFQHGTGKHGQNAATNWAMANMVSTVIGHVHSFGGVRYMNNGERQIFGLNAGCGVDEAAYAFAYGKDFAYKPTLGCGVVTDEGTTGIFVPMP